MRQNLVRTKAGTGNVGESEGKYACSIPYPQKQRISHETTRKESHTGSNFQQN